MLNGDHVDVKSANCKVEDNDDANNENDLNFEPVITIIDDFNQATLPLIDVSNNEEDETEMIKLRAKLYRYDCTSKPPEWKERGTGEVKLLRHKTKNTVRVVMRRDKTLKICANHFVTPWMELKPNCGSDRAWVWSVLADFADEQLKPELLAIRFANAENALLWKDAFENAKTIVGTECEIYAGKSNKEEKQVNSDSESSSDVSYSESTDNEEQTKICKEISKDSMEKVKTVDNTEEVTKGLKNLEVHNDDLKKQ